MVQSPPSCCIGCGCQLLKLPAMEISPSGASAAAMRLNTPPGCALGEGRSGAGDRVSRCVTPTAHDRRCAFQYRGSGASCCALAQTFERLPIATLAPKPHDAFVSAALPTHLPARPQTLS